MAGGMGDEVQRALGSLVNPGLPHPCLCQCGAGGSGGGARTKEVTLIRDQTQRLTGKGEGK